MGSNISEDISIDSSNGVIPQKVSDAQIESNTFDEVNRNFRKKQPKMDHNTTSANMSKAADQAEICGGLSTIQAFHGSKDERITGTHHAHHHQQSSQSLQVHFLPFHVEFHG